MTFGECGLCKGDYELCRGGEMLAVQGKGV